MAAAQQVGVNHEDGMNIGKASTSLIGFYGVTPIAQRSGSAQASFTITIGTSQTSWGFAASDQFNNFVLQLREIRNTLVALGLWAGA
jgi:hypothetical protein